MRGAVGAGFSKDYADYQRFSERAPCINPDFSLALVRAVCLDCADAEIWHRLSVVLDSKNRFSEALAASGRATTVRPGFREAMEHRADLLRRLGRPSDAAVELERLIQLDAENPQFHWNRALMLLLAGDYSAGWPEYEWRSKLDTRKLLGSRVRGLAQWNGFSPIDGRTIFVYAEQGLGDTIQFSRYILPLVARGAKIVFQVQKPLLRLMQEQRVFGHVTELGGIPAAFDEHCPLMSLPATMRTTIDTIPFGCEAYLRASAGETARWGKKLGARRLPRVGIVWQGAIRQMTADLRVTSDTRNVPIGLISEALDIPGIDFVSLQKGDPAESDLRGLEGTFWKTARLINAASDIGDFADTAGLIANLDLVISVDTATAHLAAALGKPTWILNRHETCWRWLLDRSDSPWYRSVKLYRQTAESNWRPVLERVAMDLRHWRDSFHFSRKPF